MFLLTSGVQISKQKGSMCVCVQEVRGHSCERRKYKHSILKNDLCRAASCENLTTLQRFLLRFELNTKTRHQLLSQLFQKLT